MSFVQVQLVLVNLKIAYDCLPQAWVKNTSIYLFHFQHKQVPIKLRTPLIARWIKEEKVFTVLPLVENALYLLMILNMPKKEEFGAQPPLELFKIIP